MSPPIPRPSRQCPPDAEPIPMNRISHRSPEAEGVKLNQYRMVNRIGHAAADVGNARRSRGPGGQPHPPQRHERPCSDARPADQPAQSPARVSDPEPAHISDDRQISAHLPCTNIRLCKRSRKCTMTTRTALHTAPTTNDQCPTHTNTPPAPRSPHYGPIRPLKID